MKRFWVSNKETFTVEFAGLPPSFVVYAIYLLSDHIKLKLPTESTRSSTSFYYSYILYVISINIIDEPRYNNEIIIFLLIAAYYNIT